MKKSFLFFAVILFSIICYSQRAVQYHYAEEFYFVKEIPALSLRGKQFRYEIAVRSNPADTLSKIRIHGIAAGKGSDDFIKSDYELETRSEQDWTVYTVVGKVDDAAYKLWFYAGVNGNGDFYFDDVNFYYEITPGKWKQLKLYNPSFEINAPDIFAGYFVSKRKSEKFRIRTNDEVFKTGRQSLNVKTFGQLPASGLVKQLVNIDPKTMQDMEILREFQEVEPYFMVFRTKKESPKQGPPISKSK